MARRRHLRQVLLVQSQAIKGKPSHWPRDTRAMQGINAARVVFRSDAIGNPGADTGNLHAEPGQKVTAVRTGQSIADNQYSHSGDLLTIRPRESTPPRCLRLQFLAHRPLQVPANSGRRGLSTATGVVPLGIE